MKGLLAAVVFVCGCDSLRVAEIQEAGPAIGTLCLLKNQKIDESSGVAISYRKQGLYWTHNDSGDGPNLYAFDSNGNDFGTYTLKNTDVVDCEDMGSRLINGKPFLFLADVGDNVKARKSVFVYKIPEPNVRQKDEVISKFETMELIYPDGAHNCETLLVNSNGDIQLVTKDETGMSGVYFGEAGKSKQTLVKIGEIKLENSISGMRLATGGCSDPESKRTLIRTYGTAFMYSGGFEDWFKSPPKQFAIPLEAQGESICFDFLGKRAITTSEGKPCKVSFSRLP